jgi:hypothetical protein
MHLTRRQIFTLVYLFIFLYLVGGIVVYRYQEKFLFKPRKLPAGQPLSLPAAWREYDLRLNDTDRLSALLATTAHPRGIVVYFHDNDENIIEPSDYISYFLTHDYEVLALDYPGFGKSTGPMSEMALYQDAAVAYKLAESFFKADSIILYGRGLGAAFATQIASLYPCKAVVVENPFYSMDAELKRYLPIYPFSWMLRYHFPVYQFIARTTVPVMILQDAVDGRLTTKQAAQLRSLLKPGDRFVTGEESIRHEESFILPYRKVLDSLLGP